MAKMSRREQKALEEFAKIAGLDADALKSLQKETYPHASSRAQAHIALDYIRQPQGYLAKTCKECGEVFGSNYRHIAFCSDACRSKEWERTMHVPWNLSGRTQRESWGGEVPLILSPATMKNIEFILRQIEEAREQGKIQVEEVMQETTSQEMIEAEPEEYPEDSLNLPVFRHSDLEPMMEFQPREETSSRADTNPQSLPFEVDPYESLDLPSFSLHD